MANETNLLRLVIAEESLNDAEQLINVLRNAGFAVRPTSVEDDEALQEALSGQNQDLLICAAHLKGLPLQVGARILQQTGKDLTLLVLSEQFDPELRREAMAIGAADLVHKDDAEHFLRVVEREFHNLGERRRLRELEAALRESERRCHALLDSSRDAIAYVHEGMHIYANAAYLEKFGIEHAEAIGGLPILNLIATEDQPRFKNFFRRYNKGQLSEDHIEVGIRGPEEENQGAIMYFSPASIDGEPCTQILIRNKTTGLELEQELATLSQRDMLTGLFNRKYFLEQLDRHISENPTVSDSPGIGLLYIQVDNLEAIRESLGITSMELVLNDIAKILQLQLDDGDMAARYADTVFILLLPNRTIHDTLGLAEGIRQAVENHVCESGSRTITTTCSIGVTMVSDGVASASQAINLACEASEVARREGGNRIHLHAAVEESESGNGGDWKHRLENALADDAFYLMYQPVVSLSGEQIERYEARLRLSGDTEHSLAPRDFMPFADQCGLTPAIDRWLTRTVLAAIAQRRKSGHEARVFTKITGGTLGDPNFLPFLTTELERLAVDGSDIIFEVSESVAVSQLNQAKAFHQGIRELGCGFTLDQFGSGLNSFQLLKHIPADYLKLDQSLCVDLTKNADIQRKVRGIVETAHTMGMQVIAGYLEEATVLAMLWQYKVDLVQGHFLQEPIPEMSYDFSGMVL